MSSELSLNHCKKKSQRQLAHCELRKPLGLNNKSASLEEALVTFPYFASLTLLIEGVDVSIGRFSSGCKTGDCQCSKNLLNDECYGGKYRDLEKQERFDLPASKMVGTDPQWPST